MKEKETPLWKSKTFGLLMAFLVGLIALAFLFPNMEDRAVAGPPPAPTPIAATAGGNDWLMVTYLSTDTVDIDINSGGKHNPAYSVVDLSHTLDVQSSYHNTATCYLDFSNDNTNWDRGLTVINAADEDVTDMQQYPIFGRYSRITCTLSNANEVTITVIGKLTQN